ncbi:MAG: NFACT family protein [Firmicutes bacterium]|nr:NFACT family protein [Bacillota bacterium]
MPLDFVAVKMLADEMNAALTSGKIEKITMPGTFEAVIFIHTHAGGRKLHIDVGQSAPHINLTARNFENPLVPSAFCMHLRKHIAGGRILSVQAEPYERVVIMLIDAYTEFGDRLQYRLITEILGRSSNLLLVKPDGKISDCLKHSPLDSDRILMPSFPYAPPKPNQPNDRQIVQTRALYESKPDPILLFDGDGVADFGYVIPKNSGYRIEQTGSLNEAADRYFSQKSSETTLTQKKNIIRQKVTAQIKKRKNKLAQLEDKARECAGADQIKSIGSLLLANLQTAVVTGGKATVTDWGTGETVFVALDPSKSLSANAQAYFKKYAKLKRAREFVAAQTAAEQELLVYYESVLDAAERAQEPVVLNEILDELALDGLIEQKNKPGKKEQVPKFTKFSHNGWEIWMGKNNLQNDYVTFRAAKPDDIWLHAREAPGSHVVIVAAKKEPNAGIIEYAAKLAAQNSKLKNAGRADVDYCKRKYVKKAGKAPGLAYYTDFKTVTVEI